MDVQIYITPNEQGFQYKVPDGRDRWRLYREDELDFEDLTDWNAFRREAAKDILCALVGNKDYLKVIGRIEPETMLAIRFVDELIKQLKQQ